MSRASGCFGHQNTRGELSRVRSVAQDVADRPCYADLFKPFLGDGGFNVDTEPIQLDDRESLCRVRNCILILARNSVMLYDTTVLYAHEASLPYQVGVSD